MANETMWVQVFLRQGERRLTTWVPTHGITVGATVTLKPDVDGNWTVLEVYDSTVLPESMMKEIKKLNRKSLPSVEGMP